MTSVVFSLSPAHAELVDIVHQLASPPDVSTRLAHTMILRIHPLRARAQLLCSAQIRSWHNPAALATGQLVRLLG